MRIIALATLRDFWNRHPDAEIPLRSWYTLASRSDWRRPADVKAAYRNASVVANKRIVFNARTEELRRESMLGELRQRIREVREGPDGLLYLLTDEDDGALLRIEPVP